MLGIMKPLCDEDLIEEDVIFKWEKQSIAKERQSMFAFWNLSLKWLHVADEEESSDEDE